MSWILSSWVEHLRAWRLTALHSSTLKLVKCLEMLWFLLCTIFRINLGFGNVKMLLGISFHIFQYIKVTLRTNVFASFIMLLADQGLSAVYFILYIAFRLVRNFGAFVGKFLPAFVVWIGDYLDLMLFSNWLVVTFGCWII